MREIISLIKEYEDRNCVRSKVDFASSDEVNSILNAIGAEEIALNESLDVPQKGSNLFDIMFYMVISLSKRIEEIEGSIR